MAFTSLYKKNGQKCSAETALISAMTLRRNKELLHVPVCEDVFTYTHGALLHSGMSVTAAASYVKCKCIPCCVSTKLLYLRKPWSCPNLLCVFLLQINAN